MQLGILTNIKIKKKSPFIQHESIVQLIFASKNPSCKNSFLYSPTTNNARMHTSNVFAYNPTAELAIANGNENYMPPLRLRIFEKDLETLPAFIAHENDTIITKRQPNEGQLKIFSLLNTDSLIFATDEELNNTKDTFYHSIKPWGWSAAMHKRMGNIKNQCSDNFKKSPNYNWTSEHPNFFSRLTSIKAHEMVMLHNHESDIVKCRAIPNIINSLDDLHLYMSRNDHSFVIKTPWSSSGRGIQMATMRNKINLQWIGGAIKQQGFVIAEQLLNKLFDMSFQFETEANGEAKYLGHTFFSTDESGNYKHSYIEAYPKEITNKVDIGILKEAISQASELLKNSLESLNTNKYYTGPIGVDAMFYLDANNQLKLDPCIELNIRYTMGYYTIQMRKKLHPTAAGIWKIEFINPQNWQQTLQNCMQQNPIVMSDDKLLKGFIPMNNPEQFAVVMILT